MIKLKTLVSIDHTFIISIFFL